MYIPQIQLGTLIDTVKANHAVLIFGPRRCGKTTLLNHFLSQTAEPYIMANGDDLTTREILCSESIERLHAYVGDVRLLAIDEAQRIPNIGIGLKLLVDSLPDMKVVATGSSSFGLQRQVGEPLTGRKTTLILYPLSQREIGATENSAQTQANLETRLIFGSYPEIVLAAGNSDRADYLKELIGSYLLKDILEMDGVRQSDKLIRLLRLLAFQIGSEVSMTELGTQLSLAKETVDRYLDLLEKSFVIVRYGGFSRNLRKEVSKSGRYYFLDNGIRNAVIANFNGLALRNDAGQLWENYIVTERLKRNEYDRRTVNSYFWRTYDRKEIDLVEESGGKLVGYEIKWGAKRPKPPKDWLNAYDNASYEVIGKENYLDFIG